MFLNKHTNTIVGYKCSWEDCPGFVSLRKDRVLLHIRCRHMCQAKPFACKDCQKRFAVASYLSVHRRLAHQCEDRPFQCSTPGCWKVFKQKKSLRHHMERHFYEKPFFCEYPNCQERFVFSYELRRHQADSHEVHIKQQ